MNSDKGRWKASSVFAPDYPRQSASGHTIQATRQNRSNFCQALNEASEMGMPGFYSVYSFPRGHSRDGKIPKVDCIFIDLDIEGDSYDPKEDATDFGDWKREMSALLARVRMIASTIIDNEEEQHFRATLSGHKGLHLYLDFPTVAVENGDFHQFKNGLKSYGKQVMEWLDATAGGLSIERWVDVDASDLGRLARYPNTIHHGASYDDTTRWCVPVTMEELAELKVDHYLKLTRNPRWPDGYTRTPSKDAGNKVVQAIRTASKSRSSTSQHSSQFDPGEIKRYENEANGDIELEDIAFLTANKPCIQAFRERDDAFNQGNASHTMEISIIARLVELGVPRDVIHEFFEDIPGYREDYTDAQITKIVGRQYEEFNCENIANRAPSFCLGNDCSVYQRNADIQK